MDPNANLREQREILDRLRQHLDDDGWSIHDPYGGGVGFDPMDDLMRLCVLVGALDDWLTRGGALPDAWWVGQRV